MQSVISNRNYKLLVLAALLLSGALIYSNTFYNSFHFDDARSIVNNPAIRNISNLKAIWNFWPTRFITYVSIALNYHLGGLKLFNYHFFNLAVHIASVILVWQLLLLTFSTPLVKREKIAKQARSISFFGALVFLAHPIQTQAVTYIIQRACLLAALFYLSSLILYVKSRLLEEEGKSPIRQKALYYSSLIMAAIAMFTKELTITLPFAILLYESCFLKTKKKLNWKRLLPFFLLILVIPLTMLLTKTVDIIGMRRAGEPAMTISSLHYLLTQFRVIITYMRLLFLPLNQNLDYDYHIAKSLLELPAIASIISLVLILTSAFKLLPKYRLLSFGAFWFFLTLLPESSIIPIRDIIFEHRLYLPMAGFSFFLPGLVYYIFRDKSVKPAIAILLIITCSYAILTYRRNFIWKDEITLWNDTAHKSPKKAKPYYNRGTAYADKGVLDLAISDFNKTIEIAPGLAEVYNNRGTVYARKGEIDRAINDYTKAIEINPTYSRAYYNRGVSFADKGNFAKAVHDFDKTLQINPNLAEAYYSRGVVFYDMREYGRARLDLHKAEELGYNADPDFFR
ncbi:MAG: tetratricopeptide repeat protein [Candidatus Omnitrophota bacterium]